MTMHHYDEWYRGLDEAHYVYEMHDSAYGYFSIEDLHPNAVVEIYYECYVR